jgi:glycosyltransferase involved in cell wall biosynthesis
MDLSLRRCPEEDFINYKKGRVSVIIPCYNYGVYIVDAVKSVMSQNFDDLEIIVVDDGSTDNTRSVLGPLRDRIKYIYQANMGPSAARNTGIVHSTGEFILFLDADDVLALNTIPAQINHLKRTCSYIAVCRNKLFTKKGNNGYPKVSGTWRLFHQNLDVHMCYFNVGPPNAFLVHRRVLDKVGLFDAELWAGEDYELWFRASVSGFVPSYNPDTTVFYRRHAKSSTTNLRRLYTFDAVVHHKLSTLLDQFPDFPKNQRVAGLMAFSAGAVVTSSRLIRLSLPGSEDLLRLAHRRIQEASDIASGGGIWNVLVQLYYLRIVSTLSLPCLRRHYLGDPIRHALRRFLSVIMAPSSEFQILTDIVRTACGGPRSYFWERWRLMTLLIEYYRNRTLTG